jgi:uncharacterized protein (DUF302 family)
MVAITLPVGDLIQIIVSRTHPQPMSSPLLAWRRSSNIYPSIKGDEGEATVSYYMAKTLPISFDDAVARTIEALKDKGFGVLTQIDIKETLKAKLGAEFPSYKILGACNPTLAFEALKLESKVGTMLPCNVVVRDAGNGQTEVAAIDPVASMIAIDNPALKQAAEQVRAKLERVIAQL